MNKRILYYIHDPMCSWCWGFEQSLDSLLKRLPDDITVQRLLGGLAPDSDVPMPVAMQETIKSHWSHIEDTIAGVKFNFDFWTKTSPRRSTYPACRAIIAARLQGDEYDILMTKAIQQAYYKQARNPSDHETLITCAKELGLVSSMFEKDLISTFVNEQLFKEMKSSTSLLVKSFPSLVMMKDNKIHSIKIDYNNSDSMLEEIMK